MNRGDFLRNIYFVVLIAILLCGCESTPVSYIQDEATAKELTEAVLKSLEDINSRIPDGFDNNFNSINGVVLTGWKKDTSIHDSGYNEETNVDNIGIRFNNFFFDNLTIRSGSGIYYYRHSLIWQGLGDEYLSIRVRYELHSCVFVFKSVNREIYRGTVTINYQTTDKLATQYEVTVSFADGKSFTFTGVRE